MPPGLRLKPYDASDAAATPLLEGDLFQAQWFPVSRSVHLIKIICEPSGATEYGEYVVGRDASRFCHSRFTLSESERADVERTLAVLRQHAAPELVGEVGEEPERRLIAVWGAGARHDYCLPRPTPRGRRRVSLEFEAAFEEAWRSLVAPVEARGAHHGLRNEQPGTSVTKRPGT